MLLPRMILRNILRQKRRSFFNCFMMTAGFVMISVSMGVSGGSYSSIIELFTRNHTGHIQIHKNGYLIRPSLYNTINHAGSLMSSIETLPYVQSSAPRIYSAVLAFNGNKSVGIRITGIDPDKESQTTRIKQKISKGEFFSNHPGNDVILSDALARNLNLKVNDNIILIGQAADGSIANDIFEVIGIDDGKGAVANSMNCYMHIKTAQNFLCLSGRIHEIAVALTDEGKTRKITKKISQLLNDTTLDIEPWQVVEKLFFKAMETDTQGQRITFLILMIVVGTGILDTVLMTILERTSEFGLLRAIGTRSFDMFKIIIAEIACLSLFSVFLGAIIAFICNYFFMKYGIALNEPFYFGGVYMERMTSKISFPIFFIPALITIATAMLVSFWPAYRAAYMPPVQAIRST